MLSLLLLLLAGRNRLEVDDGDENASTSSAVDIVGGDAIMMTLPIKITAASEANNGDVVLPMIHLITIELLHEKESDSEHCLHIACKSKRFAQ